MWFRLALKLGMSVKRCQEEIDSAEFGQWISYYSIEPFGERHDDIRMGTLAALNANVNRLPGGKVYEPSDFMPWVSKPEAVVGVDKPTGNSEAARIFGIDLAALKSKGKKTIIFKNPGVERNG
jgi:hypothetical protein